MRCHLCPVSEHVALPRRVRLFAISSARTPMFTRSLGCARGVHIRGEGGQPVSGGQQTLLVNRGGGFTGVGRVFRLLHKRAVLE